MIKYLLLTNQSLLTGPDRDSRSLFYLDWFAHFQTKVRKVQWVFPVRIASGSDATLLLFPVITHSSRFACSEEDDKCDQEINNTFICMSGTKATTCSKNAYEVHFMDDFLRLSNNRQKCHSLLRTSIFFLFSERLPKIDSSGIWFALGAAGSLKLLIVFPSFIWAGIRFSGWNQSPCDWHCLACPHELWRTSTWWSS